MSKLTDGCPGYLLEAALERLEGLCQELERPGFDLEDCDYPEVGHFFARLDRVGELRHRAWVALKDPHYLKLKTDERYLQECREGKG